MRTWRGAYVLAWRGADERERRPAVNGPVDSRRARVDRTASVKGRTDDRRGLAPTLQGTTPSDAAVGTRSPRSARVRLEPWRQMGGLRLGARGGCASPG